MTDDDRWKAATWEGNRREQHQHFHALPFGEKLELMEQMAEVAALVTKSPRGPARDRRSSADDRG